MELEHWWALSNTSCSGTHSKSGRCFNVPRCAHIKAKIYRSSFYSVCHHLLGVVSYCGPSIRNKMLKMQCNALKKAPSIVPWLAAFGTSHFIAAPPSTGTPIGRAPRPGRSPLAAWRGKYSPLGFPAPWQPPLAARRAASWEEYRADLQA